MYVIAAGIRRLRPMTTIARHQLEVMSAMIVTVILEFCSAVVSAFSPISLVKRPTSYYVHESLLENMLLMRGFDFGDPRSQKQ